MVITDLAVSEFRRWTVDVNRIDAGCDFKQVKDRHQREFVEAFGLWKLF